MSVSLRRYFSRLLGLLTAPIMLAAGAAETNLDRVVAVVNGEPILASTIDHETSRLANQILDAGESLPAEVNLRNVILNRLINRMMQLQRARKIGVEIDDDEVTDNIRKLVQRSGFQSIEQLLRAERVDLLQLRLEITEELMINRALIADNQDRLAISSTDVDFFLRHSNLDRLQPQLLLRQIQLPSTATEAAAELRRQVVEGANFADLAKASSIANNAVRGGYLGWKKATDLPIKMVAALVGIKAGEITEVVPLGNGLHILKVEAIRIAGPGEEYLVRVRLQLIERSSREEIDEVLGRLSSGEVSYGEVLAEDGREPVWVLAEQLPEPLQLGAEPVIGVSFGPFLAPPEDGSERWLIGRVVDLELTGDEWVRRRSVQIAQADRLEEIRRLWLANLRALGSVRFLAPDS